MKRFSYIFTYRQIAQDRYENLIKVLDWLNTIDDDFECIIVEQDKDKKLKLPDKEYKFDIIHKWYFNDKLFNRSWGFNLATKLANTNILFFADSDMIVPQKSIIECTNLLIDDVLDSVKPFNKLIDLNSNQLRELDVTQDVCNIVLEKGENNPLRGGWGYGSGIVAYTKKALEKIHGWDERFEGWGGEDDVQYQKTRLLLRSKMLNYKCYHLYHTRGKNNGTNLHEHYKINLNLYYRYTRRPQLILSEMKGNNKADPNRYRSLKI